MSAAASGSTAAGATREPLAVRYGHAVSGIRLDALPVAVIDKVKLCLFDFVGCTFEARHLPWSRQAAALASRSAPGEGATLIGSSIAVTPQDAAFANAVMGHGLVREDMHSGSISHLGIVVLPTLLALAERHRIGGSDFIAAAVAGYEVGGRFGRIAMDAEVARIHRPTGITGPLAAAAAGARLLRLDAAATTTAIALGGNTTVGFNQWAHTGGSEMFFHVGFAARNAVAAVGLAALGAFASPSALDGKAGLLAALGKRELPDSRALFDDSPEILSVYHKPVPACNFAQTPCQAALTIWRDGPVPVDRIAAIVVRVPRAGALYPGCDFSGPFEHVLQAKMSIQYNVAAALILGGVAESNFALLDDPRLARLIGVTTLHVDDAMTAAYPALQGAEVELVEIDGTRRKVRLDDVVNATPVDVRARFRAAVAEALGEPAADRIESCIEGLAGSADAGALASLLRADAREFAEAPAIRR